MNDLPRQQLKDLINRDRLICNDPKRCEAILLDLCGQYRKEINIIVCAIKERIPTELLNSQSSIPSDLISARLTKRLEDNLGMERAAARWAVESWEFALGIKSERALTESIHSSPAATLPAQLFLEWTETGCTYNQKIEQHQPSKYLGTVRIGRDPDRCDIVLSSPTVSALHVEIFFDSQSHCFRLRNLRINNPPTIDGQTMQFEEVELRPNNTINLGEIQLKVVNIFGSLTPTIVSTSNSTCNNPEEDQSDRRGDISNQPPTAAPQSLIRYITTPLIVLSLGPFIFFLVLFSGPILPLVTSLWLWRGNVFTGNQKKIALGINGAITSLNIMVANTDWGKFWWVNIIGIIVLIINLQSENGKITIGRNKSKS